MPMAYPPAALTAFAPDDQNPSMVLLVEVFATEMPPQHVVESGSAREVFAAPQNDYTRALFAGIVLGVLGWLTGLVVAFRKLRVPTFGE